MSKRIKPVDQFPIICTAGIITPKPEGIIGLLKSYTDNDLAQYMVKRRLDLEHSDKKDILGKIEFSKKKPKKFPTKLILAPELNKFRFKTFEEEYFEGLYYKSLKSAPFAVPAKSHSKPESVTNTSQTFGIDTKSKYSLYDVVLPKRKPIEVARETKGDHEKYPLRYKNCYPSEIISRNYDKNSYDPNTRFGHQINADCSGAYVKNAMKYCDPDKCFIGEIAKEVFERKYAEIGKKKDLQKLDLKPDTIYGYVTKPDRYNEQNLIQNEPLNPELNEFYDVLKHLEERRRYMKKLKGFWFRDVESSLREVDKSQSGFIKFETLFKIFAACHCHFNHHKCKLAANFYDLIQPETGFVNYAPFIQLLQSGVQLPKFTELLKEKNILKGTKGLSTTYRELTSDIEKKEETFSKLEPKKNERFSNKIVNGITEMKEILSPSVPTQFGLNIIDYLQPKSRDEIKIIFKKMLADISENNFAKIFEDAKNLEKFVDDKVSVEAFKIVIKKFFNENCK